jgi:hypothetical protein
MTEPSTPPEPASAEDKIAVLEEEIDDLEYDIENLRGQLEETEALVPSFDDSPRVVFEKLHHELSTWPLSAFRKLATLINQHVKELEP